MNVRETPKMRLSPLASLVALSLALSGCASQEYVHQEMGGVSGRFDTLQNQLKELSQRIDGNSVRLNHVEARLGQDEETVAGLSKRSDDTLAGLAATDHRLDGLSGDLAAAGSRIAANAAEIARAQQRQGLAESALPAAPHGVQAAAAPAAVPAAAPSATASTTPPAASPPASGRLDDMAAQIATANQRIATNSSAIDSMAARIAGVESGLGESAKHTEAGEQALAAANARIDAVHVQIDETKQAVATQATAIAAVAQRVDGVSDRLDTGDKGHAQTTVQLAQLQASVKEQGGRIDQAEKGLAQTDARLAEAVATIKAHEERLLRNESDASSVSATAKEALDRAIKAGRLAEGKLVYETVLSEDLANFDLQQARLSESSKAALTAFANKLNAENQNVYIEIQGHTDNTGSAAGNLRLGLDRAEAVRDFLHKSCGIALHRLSVISYGQTRAVADNATRAGRMKNRRVELVVLK